MTIPDPAIRTDASSDSLDRSVGQRIRLTSIILAPRKFASAKLVPVQNSRIGNQRGWEGAEKAWFAAKFFSTESRLPQAALITILFQCDHASAAYRIVLQCNQCLVHLLEGKRLHMRPHRKARCFEQKLLPVSPRVVCHTSDRALTID